MRKLVKQGVQMVKALDKAPWLRWMNMLYDRMNRYIEMKREEKFIWMKNIIKGSDVIERREVVMQRSADI